MWADIITKFNKENLLFCLSWKRNDSPGNYKYQKVNRLLRLYRGEPEITQKIIESVVSR